MNIDPSKLPLSDIFIKNQQEFANSRGWVCNCESCSFRSPGCEKACPQDAFPNRLNDCPTLKAYHRLVDKLAKHLGNKAISDITLEDVREAISQIQQEAAGFGKPYSPETIKGYYSCLNVLFRFAQDRGYMYNFLEHDFFAFCLKDTSLVEYQTYSREERRILLKQLNEVFAKKPRSFTMWQMEKLISYIRKHIYEDGRYLALAIMLYIGLRPAECRGVLWRDILPYRDHPDRCFLALYKIRGVDGTLKNRMKTSNAFRKVPIHIELLELIFMRIEHIKKNYNGCIDNLPICCIENQFETPCKDFQLASFAEEVFCRALRLTEELYITYALTMEEENLDAKESTKNTHLTLYVLRRNFFTWLSYSTSLTSEEKRYLMGHEVILDKKNQHRMFNDEDLLWNYQFKLDQSVLCNSLHQKHLTQTAPVDFSNCGVVRIHIPKEDIMKGIIHVRLTTTEPGSRIFLTTIQKPRCAVMLQGQSLDTPPTLSLPRGGINCEKELLEAHRSPSPPARDENTKL